MLNGDLLGLTKFQATPTTQDLGTSRIGFGELLFQYTKTENSSSAIWKLDSFSRVL